MKAIYWLRLPLGDPGKWDTLEMSVGKADVNRARYCLFKREFIGVNVAAWSSKY